MGDLRDNLERLNDSQLDEFFASARGAAQTEATSVIVDRLSSFRSFVGGVFGENRFPKYQASVNFSQADTAQKSISDTVKNSVDAVAGSSLKIAMPIIIAALVVILAWAYLKKK